MAMVDVIMPVYLRQEEHKKVIIDTIDSVAENTLDYRLIVVDDGSPLSLDFVKERADKFLTHPNNQGISAAWNTGKNSATSEYVAVINDDIKVSSGWLVKLVEGFSKSGVGVIAPMLGGREEIPRTFDIAPYEDHKFYPGYCFMLKRDRFFEDFDEQFTSNCGDTDYWHRIRAAGLGCYRSGLTVWHKEGDVLHGMGYKDLSDRSIKLFKEKWGFDPQKEYYG